MTNLCRDDELKQIPETSVWRLKFGGSSYSEDEQPHSKTPYFNKFQLSQSHLTIAEMYDVYAQKLISIDLSAWLHILPDYLIMTPQQEHIKLDGKAA